LLKYFVLCNRRYVREASDAVCTRLAKSILDAYETHLHTVPDAVFFESLHHRDIILDKTSSFVGREDLLAKISKYLGSPSTGSGRVYAVHGNSGCGKTALLAMVAQRAARSSSKPYVVVRFLGTSMTSSSGRAMLRSVCQQICRVYASDVTSVRITVIHCVSEKTTLEKTTLMLHTIDSTHINRFR